MLRRPRERALSRARSIAGDWRDEEPAQPDEADCVCAPGHHAEQGKELQAQRIIDRWEGHQLTVPLPNGAGTYGPARDLRPGFPNVSVGGPLPATNGLGRRHGVPPADGATACPAHFLRFSLPAPSDLAENGVGRGGMVPVSDGRDSSARHRHGKLGDGDGTDTDRPPPRQPVSPQWRAGRQPVVWSHT